jgi:osmotically-inducible protein OsmY
MMKRLSVGICSVAVVCVTAGFAAAQSTTQEVKDKTASAAHKTGEVLSDAEITTAVKTKLMADKLVSGFKIDVDTDKGVVTLSGPVDTAAERAHAANIAQHTHGVKRVVDKLTIEKKSAANKTNNPSMTEKTEHAAKKTGEATEDAAKKAGEATESAAKKTGSAVKGTSGTVAKDTGDAAKATGRYLTDAEITTAVKTKLAADSGVHSMDVHVDTDKGVVTLTGSVRSDAEKADTLRIARDTMGVKNVVDKLTVK